mmetsp:Transcript_18427/g.29969  ORF Transcript_18427/g.29969 Transcript_18427/m.29969 type:complete len:532 (+) Transcript_18427:88-1683(+)
MMLPMRRRSMMRAHILSLLLFGVTIRLAGWFFLDHAPPAILGGERSASYSKYMAEYQQKYGAYGNRGQIPSPYQLPQSAFGGQDSSNPPPVKDRGESWRAPPREEPPKLQKSMFQNRLSGQMGTYRPPTDPVRVMKGLRAEIRSSGVTGSVHQAEKQKRDEAFEQFENEMGALGVDLENVADVCTEDENLPKIPDDLNEEEKALLDPRIVAKQLRESERLKKEYEMLDDDLGLAPPSDEMDEMELRKEHKAKANIKARPQPKEREVYAGRVTSLRPFGAFVDFGCSRNGLVPLREICDPTPRKIEDMLYLHDEVAVFVEKIDDEGKVFLTMKGLNPGLTPTKDREAPAEPDEPVKAYQPPAKSKETAGAGQNHRRKRFQYGGIPDWETVTDPLQRKLYEYDLEEREQHRLWRKLNKENRLLMKKAPDMADKGAMAWHAFLHSETASRVKERAEDMAAAGFKNAEHKTKWGKKKKQQDGRGIGELPPKRKRGPKAIDTTARDLGLSRGVQVAAERGWRTTPRYGGASGEVDV